MNNLPVKFPDIESFYRPQLKKVRIPSSCCFACRRFHKNVFYARLHWFKLSLVKIFFVLKG